MKKIIKKIIMIIIICVLLAYSNISTATNSLNNLKDEKEDIKNEISTTQEELDGIHDEQSETLQQVEKLISQISAYQSEIEELNEKIVALETKIAEAEKQIKEDEIEYAKEQKASDDRLVAMYQTGETSYLDFLLSSASLIDFISSYYLISEITNYDTKMLEQLEEHKQKIEKQKEELEQSKKELNSSKTTVLSKQQGLKVAKKTKEEYAAQLTEKEKQAQQKLEELQETNDELDKQIKAAQAAIEAAKRAAAAKSQSNSSYAPSTATSSSGFIKPVLSRYNVTTGLYYKTSGKYHGAVDYSGSGISGTPIYAVADGYVVTSTAKTNSRGQFISYGNYILIAHYNGLYTLYAHCNSRAVSAGETVTQGQVIGTVGSTGNSTGPHLHFEVRAGNGSYSSRVNPLNYLPQ